MDTREKIIDAAQAARIAQDGAVVVSGYFDPMTAGLAERLVQLKQNGKLLLVLIRTPGDAILPARARAQLVAALRVVDVVCDEQLTLDVAHKLETEHRRQFARLVAHVHQRQKAK